MRPLNTSLLSLLLLTAVTTLLQVPVAPVAADECAVVEGVEVMEVDAALAWDSKLCDDACNDLRCGASIGETDGKTHIRLCAREAKRNDNDGNCRCVQLKKTPTPTPTVTPTATPTATPTVTPTATPIPTSPAPTPSSGTKNITQS